jgi:SAM-dependent methyltransferase
MTDEMLDLARRNAAKGTNGQPFTNVEFHKSTIDKLPLADGSVDCVISNCVINLAPDKPAVFLEIARVLKPGGRVALSDIALKQPLPEELARDLHAYVGCIAGAIPIEEYRRGLARAGFAHVEVVDTAADLNAYAMIEGQSACCSPAASDGCATADQSASSLPLANLPIAGPPPARQSDEPVHRGLSDLLARYNANDYAASVRVFAVKDHHSLE